MEFLRVKMNVELFYKNIEVTNHRQDECKNETLRTVFARNYQIYKPRKQ